ncbi:hypothetical protein DRJ48_00805 [Candidatus Woesearchaeota archaeon]|nr:NFACT family protein [Candidatus Woesearchaeota archaeon]RLE43481.1 MAG: hypothetical protein DRJ48_00805 [Candidatus Woesearchaeota archaeon]
MGKHLSLSSIDIGNLMLELSGLVGARINKVYQFGDKFTLRLKTKQGTTNLNIVFPGLLFVSESVKYATPEATSFVMSLRKHIANAFIESINQIGAERIVNFGIIKGNQKLKLVVELFSKGNLLLLDENNKILIVLHSQTWSNRELKRGRSYVCPPNTIGYKANPKEIEGLIKQTKQPSLVKFLAVELGLGGIYAEELCFVNRWDKEGLPQTVSPADIHKAIHKLLDRKLNPTIYYSEEHPIALSSYVLKSLANLKSEPYDSISAMVEHYLQYVEQHEESPLQARIQKQERMIEKQKQHLKQLELSVEENMKKGELIYERYQELKQLFNNLERIREKKGWNAVFEFLEKHPKVKSVSRKNFSFVYEA